jgi:hypothetical protein
VSCDGPVRGSTQRLAQLLPRNTGEARLIPRGTPGEMVELIDWDEFVKYLDKLGALPGCAVNRLNVAVAGSLVIYKVAGLI